MIPTTPKSFLVWHDAHPVVLGALLLKQYGPHYIEWDHDALKMSIQEDYKVLPSSQNWQKIQAFRTLLSSDAPWKEWEVFENLIQALNNNIPDPDIVQVCTVAQLIAGIQIIESVREKEEWSEEIWKYVASCALEQGITWLPEPLTSAMPWIEEPWMECPTCDHVVDIDTVNLKCIQSFDTEFPLNHEGTPSACPLRTSSWVSLVKKRRDGSAVAPLFEKWKDLEQLEFYEKDEFQLQAAKLVVANRYASIRKSQMREQLKTLNLPILED